MKQTTLEAHVNDVERRTNLLDSRTDSYHRIGEFLEVLLLLLLKNILQKTAWEYYQGTQPFNSFEPYDSESSTDTDSTNEYDE